MNTLHIPSERLFRMQHRYKDKCAPVLFVLLLSLAACSTASGTGGSSVTPLPGTTQSASSGTTPAPTTTALPAQVDTCPRLIGYPTKGTYCYTPHQLRVAYGVESLLEHGFTG